MGPRLLQYIHPIEWPTLMPSTIYLTYHALKRCTFKSGHVLRRCRWKRGHALKRSTFKIRRGEQNEMRNMLLTPSASYGPLLDLLVVLSHLAKLMLTVVDELI